MTRSGFAHIPLLIGAVVIIGVVSLFALRTNNNVNPVEEQQNEVQVSEENSEQDTEPTEILNPTPTPQLSTNPTPTPKTQKSITAKGLAYEDRNNDGVYNSNDAGIANMQFYIYDTDNPDKQLHTIYSGQDGHFTFTFSVYGKLRIKPTGYNNYTSSSSHKDYSGNDNEQHFSFRSNSVPVVTNSGIIEGDIYHDTNQNQSRDNGESGVYFYKLYLIGSNGTYYNTIENAQTTDSGGHFKYTNLPVPGTYNLQLSNPTGSYVIYNANNNVTLTTTNTQNTNVQIPVFKNN